MAALNEAILIAEGRRPRSEGNLEYQVLENETIPWTFFLLKKWDIPSVRERKMRIILLTFFFF